MRCDGLVAATPAGSTGYNLANRGPILAWGVEGYVVSFIAPHSLTARPLVVAPDDVLSVANAAGRDPVDVALDGEHVGELASGAEMEVRFRDGVGAPRPAPGSNFYRRIREKFGRLAHEQPLQQARGLIALLRRLIGAPAVRSCAAIRLERARFEPASRPASVASSA